MNRFVCPICRVPQLVGAKACPNSDVITFFSYEGLVMHIEAEQKKREFNVVKCGEAHMQQKESIRQQEAFEAMKESSGPQGQMPRPLFGGAAGVSYSPAAQQPSPERDISLKDLHMQVMDMQGLASSLKKETDWLLQFAHKSAELISECAELREMIKKTETKADVVPEPLAFDGRFQANEMPDKNGNPRKPSTETLDQVRNRLFASQALEDLDGPGAKQPYKTVTTKYAEDPLRDPSKE